MQNRIYDSGLLSDVDIRAFLNNGISITSSGTEGYYFDPDKQIQYGSIDLHFRHDCKRMKVTTDGVIDYDDLKHHSYTEAFEIENDELLIEPGEIILTTTQEVVNISAEFAGIITGRSSIARLGVMVHCSQEFINPGHGQTIPLQLVNLGDNTVRIPITSTICQLILFKLRTPSSGSYVTKEGAKYADEIGPSGSKLYEEFGQDIASDNTFKKEKAIKNRSKKVLKDNNKKLWGIMIGQVLASLIAALFTSSVVINTINGQTVSSTLSGIGVFLGNIPLVAILILVLFIAYYIVTKWGLK